MTQIDVLPLALVAAARDVRDAAPDAHVPVAELGDAALTGALTAYLGARSCAELLHAVEDAAGSLSRSGLAYRHVEALLVPRALR